MTTSSETSKALRGTKRVCPACEVRFYDLARDAIVCPSCGVPYTPAFRPVADVGARTTSSAGRTGWRGRSIKQPRLAPETDVGRGISPEVAPEQEEADSVSDIDAHDDIVLEQHEPEDGDVSRLVDHDIGEAKEP
jgi:uncharacterized protein (TIGR02300 family)